MTALQVTALQVTALRPIHRPQAVIARLFASVVRAVVQLSVASMRSFRHRPSLYRPLLCASLVALSIVPGVRAQLDDRLAADYDGAGVVEHLGELLPLDLVFADEDGDSVAVGDFFGTKPVLLSFAYHECPMLCSVVLDGMAKTMAQMDWTPGEEFEVVTVSIAANETAELARLQKEKFVQQIGKTGADNGWHFLTGKRETIDSLAHAAGFQFKWIEQAEQYVHPAVLIFAGTDGKITRYLYGIDYPPRDVRTALVEASSGTIGTTLDRLILFCYQYDSTVSGYVLQATKLMKLGGFLMIAAMVALFIGLRRKERRSGDRRERWARMAHSSWE